MSNINLNFNEMITSIDAGDLESIDMKGCDEVMKEIYYLREQISKKLSDISTIDTDLELREKNFLEDFNLMDKEKKELYKKLENEFIYNSHLYFDSDRNNVIFKNLKSDIINDDNVGYIIHNIRKSMSNLNNVKLSFSMDNIHSRSDRNNSKNNKERSNSPKKLLVKLNSRGNSSCLKDNSPSTTYKNKSNMSSNNSLPLKNLKNLNKLEANNSLNIQLNTKGSLVTGVKLNRAFFAIRQKTEIERAKDNSNLDIDYCRKHCGEKLFKNLDLNQRYYLTKGNKINLHCENCQIFIKENYKIRSSSITTSHREKRKMNSQNAIDETLLNSSVMKTITNGVLDNSLYSHKNNSSKIINDVSGYSNDPSFEFENKEFNKGNCLNSRRKSN